MASLVSVKEADLLGKDSDAKRLDLMTIVDSSLWLLPE